MALKELLIIENDPKFRNAIKRALVQDAYSFVEASSIQAGLEICRQPTGPRVILLDLELPDGNGKEFMQCLGADIFRYRIIVLTAHEEYLAAELAHEFQVFRYLHKPGRIMESLRFTVAQAFKDIEVEELKNKITILSRNPIKVFISYTNPDFDKVNWVYRRLKDHGFNPWMDQLDMLVGYNWKKQVEQAINDSHFVLSCLSDISVKRLGFFQTETHLAIAKHDRVGEPFILPLKFDNCEMPIEFVERNIQYINFDSLHDDWWLKLLKTLRSEV